MEDLLLSLVAKEEGILKVSRAVGGVSDSPKVLRFSIDINSAFDVGDLGCGVVLGRKGMRDRIAVQKVLWFGKSRSIWEFGVEMLCYDVGLWWVEELKAEITPRRVVDPKHHVTETVF